jgi:hypothetical protein
VAQVHTLQRFFASFGRSTAWRLLWSASLMPHWPHTTPPHTHAHTRKKPTRRRSSACRAEIHVHKRHARGRPCEKLALISISSPLFQTNRYSSHLTSRYSFKGCNSSFSVASNMASAKNNHPQQLNSGPTADIQRPDKVPPTAGGDPQERIPPAARQPSAASARKKQKNAPGATSSSS